MADAAVRRSGFHAAPSSGIARTSTRTSAHGPVHSLARAESAQNVGHPTGEASGKVTAGRRSNLGTPGGPGINTQWPSSTNEILKSLLGQQHEMYAMMLDSRLGKMETVLEKQCELLLASVAAGAGERVSASLPKQASLSSAHGGHSSAVPAEDDATTNTSSKWNFVMDLHELGADMKAGSSPAWNFALDLPPHKEEIKEDKAVSEALSGALMSDVPSHISPLPTTMVFEPRAGWQEKEKKDSKSTKYGRKTTQPAVSHRFSEEREEASRQGRSMSVTGAGGSCGWLIWAYHNTVISPQSPLHVFWEFSGVFIVLFDMFELPIQVFDPPTSSIVLSMQRVAQLFWNADLLVSFRIGYINNEDVVLEPHRVARHYLRSWFLFDLIIVLVDWILFFQEQQDQSPFFAKAGKVFKAFRTVRTVKMVRMLKMRGAFHAVEEHMVHLFSGSGTPVLGIFKFLLGIMLVCHFLCSAWYFVGDRAGVEGWVDRFDVHQRPFWDKYLMTFHWSLTQFGVGESQLQGLTAGEYVCNIAILISGLVFTALLVSSVTNTFSILQQQTADQFHQMWLLRRFCYTYEFPRSLSKRIIQHVDQYLSSHAYSRTELGDVKLLGKLSAPLHAQVLFHVFLRPMQTHPFLRVLCRDDSYTMRAVATAALEELLLAEKDLVFIRGAKAECCFNVIAGSMHYDFTPGWGCGETTSETIPAMRWISEPVLWTEWVRCGDLYANTAARCMAVDVELFISTVTAHADTLMLVQAYAFARVEELQGLDPMEISDIMAIDVENMGFLHAGSYDFGAPAINRRMSERPHPNRCMRFLDYMCGMR